MAEKRDPLIKNKSVPSPSTLPEPMETGSFDSVHFYKLVSGFSSALINIPFDRLESELGIWFRQLAEFLNVDSISAATFSADSQKFVLLQEYAVSDPQVIPSRKIFDMAPSPEKVQARLFSGKALIAERIPDDLTKDELKMDIVRAGAKSFISVPLSAQNEVLGVLALSVFRHERRWPDDLVLGIRLIGEIIANALLRRRNQIALQAEIDQRRRAEHRYATIIKTANVGFWIIERITYKIIEANDTACAISGYSRDELLKKKVTEIECRHTAEGMDAIIKKLREVGYINHFTQHRRKDGTVIDVAVNSNLLREEGLIFSFMSDITDLKRVQKEIEERLMFEKLLADFSAALINTSPKELEDALGIWMVQLARFLKVDRCSISEYVEEYKRRRFLHFYIHPSFENMARTKRTNQPSFQLYELIKNGDILKLNHIPEDVPDIMEPDFKKRIMADGTKSLLAMPLMAGKVVLGLMLLASYTYENLWNDHLVRRLALVAEIISNALMREHKDGELSRYRRRLEKMVDERTFQLKEAQDELIKSARLAALGKMAATVSHELRNPLGTIRSSLYAADQRLGENETKIRTSLGRAERSIERCDRIIDELLSFTHLQYLNFVSTPIDSWLEDLLSSEPPLRGIRVERTLGADVTVPIDQERFRRCLINLLTNAYQAIDARKVGGSKGRVAVTSRINNGHLEISIADNGVGFDQKDGKKLFEPLYSTKSFGVGLGMSIAKQIIEQHGGRIHLDGRPGEGAMVVLRISLSERDGCVVEEK